MISVIICTYNRASTLKTTLESLQGLSHSPEIQWELIVVDNKSSDSTKECVEGFSKNSGLNVRYVFEENQGLSCARNAGIRAAAGDILAFTDDDVTVEPSWLTYIQSALADSDVMGVGGKIIPVWTSKKPRWYVNEGPYSLMSIVVTFDLGSVPCEMKTPPFGANMVFRRAAFQKYGFFRTDLGRIGKNLFHGEDSEFGRRLLDGGERLLYMPKAIIYHPVEPERITKRYAESWYLMYGKTSVRRASLSVPVASCFGVPRHLLRKLIETFFMWTFTLNPDHRFYHKLQLYLVGGQIAESHSQHRNAH